MEITKTTLTAFCVDFADAVKELENKYGVAIQMKKIGYSDDEFSAKIEVKNKDSHALFNIGINPFLRKINVKHLESGRKYTYSYDDIDEWFSHSFDKSYEFHLLYDDDKLSFSIYLDKGLNTDYNTSLPFNLDIIVGG